MYVCALTGRVRSNDVGIDWGVCARVLVLACGRRGDEGALAFSLQAAYGDSDSLQKKRAVFVPALRMGSPGAPCVWEM